MKRIVLFILALIIWCLLTWALSYQTLLVGLMVSIIVTLLFGEMFTQEPGRFLQVRRYLWFLYYIPIFIYEMIKANLDVAYRVLHPKLPINPGIVKVKVDLKRDISKTFLGNSITLTPGTMTVDIRGNHFYIHWINVRAVEVDKATEMIVRDFQNILREVFE